MTYEQALEYIHSRPRVKKTDFHRGMRRLLEYLGNQVDYVLTHDAPSQLLEFTGWKQQDINAFQLWLNKLSKTLQYKKWYFGRYHKDRNISPRATAVFCGVHTLE